MANFTWEDENELDEIWDKMGAGEGLEATADAPTAEQNGHRGRVWLLVGIVVLLVGGAAGWLINREIGRAHV